MTFAIIAAVVLVYLATRPVRQRDHTSVVVIGGQSVDRAAHRALAARVERRRQLLRELAPDVAVDGAV